MASSKESVAPVPKFLRMAQSTIYSYADENGIKNFTAKRPVGLPEDAVTAIKTEYAVFAAPEPLAKGELYIYKCKGGNGKYEYKPEDNSKDSTCTHLIVGPPNSNWRLAGVSATDISWVHRDSQKADGKVTVWMLRNNANHNARADYVSIKELTVFDCARKTYSLVEWIAYEDEDGTGDVVASHSNLPKPIVNSIAPDTVGEANLRVVCETKPLQKKKQIKKAASATR